MDGAADDDAVLNVFWPRPPDSGFWDSIEEVFVDGVFEVPRPRLKNGF